MEIKCLIVVGSMMLGFGIYIFLEMYRGRFLVKKMWVGVWVELVVGFFFDCYICFFDAFFLFSLFWGVFFFYGEV